MRVRDLVDHKQKLLKPIYTPPLPEISPYAIYVQLFLSDYRAEVTVGKTLSYFGLG